ncbi:cytochrome P450 [Cadophora sp. DSE1049]|nr:cytochrome P450 [Cadophora sp. DSE1049]
MFSSVVAVCIACFLAYIFNQRSREQAGDKNGKPIPGPPSLPILGNLCDIPKSHSWFRFKEWTDHYGPIVRFKIGASEHVIIAEEKIANDLLRERGSHYSSRVFLPMAAEYLSGNMRPLFMPYNDLWRTSRKLMHRLTMPSMANSYQPAQSIESARLLHDLLQDPRNYERWLQRYSGGLIFRIVYGKRVQTGEENYLQRAIKVVHNVERIASPGSYLVDVLPFLRYVPYPLAPFKQEGMRLHSEELDLFRSLLDDARKELETPDVLKRPSFAQTFLEEQEAIGLTFDQGAYVLGSLFEAGTGTTAAAMMSFLLTMTLHPQWQEFLWAELDAVVGDRMPDFEDIPRLPRVRAVIKEVLRWRPVTAGGAPHTLTKDDEYNGFKFAAGTTFHPVQWAIHLDPVLYPDPDQFDPSRWLDPSFPTYKRPLDKFPTLQNFSAFGFGRRICPGMNIAERSLYILTARIAWACKISKAKDSQGVIIDVPSYDYTSGFNVMPKNFAFNLSPRSKLHEQVVEERYRYANNLIYLKPKL